MDLSIIRDLWYWRHGGDSFTCQLFSLIQKADPSNRVKLRRAFPEEVEAWSQWYNSSSEEEFFKNYRLSNVL